MTQTIAITSAKPGLGKTFFATSLACALAYIKNKVLFFDASLGADNINEQLNIGATDDIPLVLTGKKTINQVLIKNPKPSFDIITSIGGIFKLSDIPMPRQSLLLEDLKTLSYNYDNLIIDLPTSNITHYNCDTLIILCNDEPSSISKCLEIIKQNSDKNISIIINFANSLIDGSRMFENIKKACIEYINITPRLLGVIRKDSRIRDAIRNKTPIINRYPNSDASIDIFNIAKRIASNEQ